jgi:hypothetical protein
MQISCVVLVYDVKISQLGRKNLAVRFNLMRIKWRRLPKTPSPVGKRSARSCKGRGSISDMERHEGFEHAFRPCPRRRTCCFVPNICSSLPCCLGFILGLPRIGKSASFFILSHLPRVGQKSPVHLPEARPLTDACAVCRSCSPPYYLERYTKAGENPWRADQNMTAGQPMFGAMKFSGAAKEKRRRHYPSLTRRSVANRRLTLAPAGLVALRQTFVRRWAWVHPRPGVRRLWTVSGGGFDGLLGVSILVLRGDASREKFLNGVVVRCEPMSSTTWKVYRFILSELDAAR